MAGRKPKPDDLRRSASLGLRITQALRSKLDETAAAAGRSISEEVEARLGASFDAGAPTKKLWGGSSEARAMAGLFCRLADEIEGQTGKPFQLDRFTYDHVEAGFARILGSCRPEGTGDPPAYPAGIVELATQFPGITPSTLFTDAQRAEWAKAPVGLAAALRILVKVLQEPSYRSFSDDERAFYKFVAARIGKGHIRKEVFSEIVHDMKQGGEPE